MKTKKTTISYENFQKKLETSGLDFDNFLTLFYLANSNNYFWTKNITSIPHYIEPILDVLIELKEKYLKNGGNFSFLNEFNEEKELKKQELNEELEKAKKTFSMIKENKILENKIAKIKNQLIFKKGVKNEKKFVG